MPAPVFTFDTTHHALWAEEIAAGHGIPCQVVPAPAGAAARCDLALETLPEDVPRLGSALAEEGVEFRIFAPEGGAATSG